MPLLEMRDLLSRTGHADLSRLDDHQIRKEAPFLLRSAGTLRSLPDIKTVLEFFAHPAAGDRIGLSRLFHRAVELLDFKVEPSSGLLFAGQYATYLEPWMPPDDRLTEEIRSEETLPPLAAGNTPLGTTPGGKWLLPWNLRYLLGGDGEDRVWAQATRIYVESLTREVKVLLPAGEFNAILRQPPWHTLYQVPNIKRVIYILDDDWRKLVNPPPQLFADGVVKTAFGIPLLLVARK